MNKLSTSFGVCVREREREREMKQTNYDTFGLDF